MGLDIENSFADFRFLVVEDNTFTSIVICKTLNSIGINSVVTATDGQAALDRIDADPDQFDVTLLDLRMPGMGGVEFLERLADRKYAGQVILTSGVNEEILTLVEKKARDKEIQLLGTLPKPLDAKSLTALLMQIPGDRKDSSSG